MDSVTEVLDKLERCIAEQSWESLESDWLEIKPVPATGNAWDSIRESVCAFLNTRGGVIVLGVKEEQKPQRHFTFTGYSEAQGGNLVELRHKFRDFRAQPIDISDCLRSEIRIFHTGQIAIIQVSALPEDRKFAFYKGIARERIVDRDQVISGPKVEEQEERKREMETYRELRPVEGISLADLSLQRINELVLLINQGETQGIETIKPTLEAAVPFLERRRFLRQDGQLTTLGVLVCATHPEDSLHFRCHLDTFVESPSVVVQDKKTFRTNTLQLMEAGHAWTLRNIMTGVSTAAGGTRVPEFPEKLIRESINNAFAHRDYSIDRPVQISIQPQVALTIRNPGQLPHELILEQPDLPIPVRRIFANPRARNPRLADVLKLHSKWEGKGIGLSALVNYALADAIDVPYYLFHSAEELSLRIPWGKVLDDATAAWFDLADRVIGEKTNHTPLSREQLVVLAYLLKSERLNRSGRYTLALTPSNNHANAIGELQRFGLIELLTPHDRFKEVYVVCRELAIEDCFAELTQLFAGAFQSLDLLGKQTLNMIALAEKLSVQGGLNAKEVSRLLKPRLPDEYAKRGEDEFYRAIRYRVERNAPDKKPLTLDSTTWHADPTRMLAIRGPANRPLFRLNRQSWNASSWLL